MAEACKLEPCIDCPAIVRRNSTVYPGETVIKQTPDSFRVISVYAEGNVAGVINEDITVSNYRHSISACEGPETSNQEVVRKKWFGLVSFKKTVELETCPATQTSKIRSIR